MTFTCHWSVPLMGLTVSTWRWNYTTKFPRSVAQNKTRSPSFMQTRHSLPWCIALNWNGRWNRWGISVCTRRESSRRRPRLGAGIRTAPWSPWANSIWRQRRQRNTHINKHRIRTSYVVHGSTHLRLLYMLEWTGRPYWSRSTSSVYTHVPPILPVCSNATHVNSGSSAKFFSAARPDAPQPMMPTDVLFGWSSRDDDMAVAVCFFGANIVTGNVRARDDEPRRRRITLQRRTNPVWMTMTEHKRENRRKVYTANIAKLRRHLNCATRRKELPFSRWDNVITR